MTLRLTDHERWRHERERIAAGERLVNVPLLVAVGALAFVLAISLGMFR